MNVNHIVIRAAILVASLSAAESLLATDLTFDGTFSSIDQTYGDRVTSTTMGAYGYGQHGEGFTPNVTVEYDPVAGSPRVWPNGYGDLAGPTLYESFSSGVKLQVKLSADLGFPVRLLRWDMATFTAFHANGETIDSVTVYNAVGTPVFSQSHVFIPSTGHLRFDTFPNPLMDTMLTLEFDGRNITTAFGNEDIGLDNIVFSQVPEPSCIVLGLIGAVLTSSALRRKRTRAAR